MRAVAFFVSSNLENLISYICSLDRIANFLQL